MKHHKPVAIISRFDERQGKYFIERRIDIIEAGMFDPSQLPDWINDEAVIPEIAEQRKSARNNSNLLTRMLALIGLATS